MKRLLEVIRARKNGNATAWDQVTAATLDEKITKIFEKLGG